MDMQRLDHVMWLLDVIEEHPRVRPDEHTCLSVVLACRGENAHGAASQVRTGPALIGPSSNAPNAESLVKRRACTCI